MGQPARSFGEPNSKAEVVIRKSFPESWIFDGNLELGYTKLFLLLGTGKITRKSFDAGNFLSLRCIYLDMLHALVDLFITSQLVNFQDKIRFHHKTKSPKIKISSHSTQRFAQISVHRIRLNFIRNLRWLVRTRSVGFPNHAGTILEFI